ncbi:MAG: LytTR family DNA-binding domain-containing protein [Methylococcaceae bacterium]
MTNPNNEIITVIVDDKESARLEFKKALPEDSNINIVAEANDVRTGFEAIEKHQPDVVFLDIHMEESDSGIQLARKIQYKLPKPPIIVFISAYDDHSIAEIVDIHPLCFLTKMISTEALTEAITAIKAALKKKSSLNKIIITKGRDIYVINPKKEILYIRTHNNSSVIYLTDDRMIETNITLYYFVNWLKPINICRSHGSFVINLNKVQAIIADENGNSYKAIIEGCDRRIHVSRGNRNDIFEKLNALL